MLKEMLSSFDMTDYTYEFVFLLLETILASIILWLELDSPFFCLIFLGASCLSSFSSYSFFFFFLAGNSLSSQHQEGSAFNNLCMRDEQRSIDSREVDLSDFESVQSG